MDNRGDIKKYDLHSHTVYSLCSNTSPGSYLKVALKRGLDGVAVTDHNTIVGALKLKKINKNKNFEIVVSSEIKTNLGEVLIYYQQEEIKKSDFFEVVDEAKSQDALISIAHPFRPLSHTGFTGDFAKIRGLIEGVECINGRNMFFGNKRAVNVAEKYDFAKTGGSDSHLWFEIGRAYTWFESSLSLREAICKRKTSVRGNPIFAPLGIILTLSIKPLRVWKLYNP